MKSNVNYVKKLAFLLYLLPLSAQSGNLFNNHEFSSNTNGWDLFQAEWFQQGNVQQGSVRFTGTGTISQCINLPKEGRYRFELDALSPVIRDTGFFDIQWQFLADENCLLPQNGGTLVGSPLFVWYPEMQNSWGRFSSLVQIPASAKSIILFLNYFDWGQPPVPQSQVDRFVLIDEADVLPFAHYWSFDSSSESWTIAAGAWEQPAVKLNGAGSVMTSPCTALSPATDYRFGFDLRIPSGGLSTDHEFFAQIEWLDQSCQPTGSPMELIRRSPTTLGVRHTFLTTFTNPANSSNVRFQIGYSAAPAGSSGMFIDNVRVEPVVDSIDKIFSSGFEVPP